MRKHILIATLTLSILAVFGAVTGAQTAVLKVGATPVPHAEILEFVKPLLKAEGIDLQIVEFTDYVRPNLALNDGELDANFFQHIPYLDTFSADHRLNLVSFAKIHIEPMGLYSKRVTQLSQLPNGARIAIPNDVTNGGRALLLLADAGLIELRAGAGVTATPFDIVRNPKNLRFQELEAALLPRVLDELDAAIINTNYALEAGLIPLRDALVIEGEESPYVNIVAIRSADTGKAALQKLADVLTRPEVKTFILDTYKGAVVPVF